LYVSNIQKDSFFKFKHFQAIAGSLIAVGFGESMAVLLETKNQFVIKAIAAAITIILAGENFEILNNDVNLFNWRFSAIIEITNGVFEKLLSWNDF